MGIAERDEIDCIVLEWDKEIGWYYECMLSGRRGQEGVDSR